MILDNNGKRIYSRYFNNDSALVNINDQKEFEKMLGTTVLNLNVARNQDS